MGKNIFILISILVPSFSFGQSAGAAYLSNSQVDLAISGGKRNFSSALAWTRFHPVALRGKFQVGYGIRFTGFVAGNKYYTTAPAKYTSTVQNLGTIFSPTINENIDTITTATAQTNSVNIMLALQYAIAPKFELGFNIDIAGVTFGKSRQFDIISSTFDAGQEPVQHGAPTRYNFLLTSDNDIGSLNSELYFRYWLTPCIGLRTGLTFLFSEYSIDRKLSFNNGEIMNERFRYKAGMALLAITIKPFSHLK
jgi:hypothetical protein